MCYASIKITKDVFFFTVLAVTNRVEGTQGLIRKWWLLRELRAFSLRYVMTGLLTEPHEKKQWLPDLLGNGRELHDVKRFVEHGRAHTRVHDHGGAALPAEERLEEPRQLAFSERDNQRVAPAAKDEAELRI